MTEGGIDQSSAGASVRFGRVTALSWIIAASSWALGPRCCELVGKATTHAVAVARGCSE